MIAIYARKSTEQSGVSDEQKSVTRQIAQATRYATSQGWTVAEAHIYTDDGISGAEFAARPGFVRLMNAVATKPRPPFDILVMAEESRLGREAIETAYALKQIIQAGVRVFFYLEGRERTLDSPTDKIMLSLTTFADELERVKARQRTADAMWRKARAGHVTGGRVFGYRNVDVMTSDGKRSHVAREIDPEQAAIVRRMFEMCAAGYGNARIARTLNAERAPAPRAQRGRPDGWAPSAVHAVLRRPLYRGVVVYGKTKQRDQWGRTTCIDRPETDWVTVHQPALQIVPDALWQAAQGRLSASRAKYLDATGGRTYGRSRDQESKYLLPGFGRCGVCGGGLHVRTRQHGGKRVAFYACTAHWNRGPHVCPNGELVRLDATDRAVLGTIVGQVLDDTIISAVIEGVVDALRPEAAEAEADRLRRELATVDGKIRNLAAGIEAAGPMPALVRQLRARQEDRDALTVALGQAEGRAARVDREVIAEAVKAKLADWRGLASRQTSDARAFLREVLTAPIVFHPEGRKAFRFEGEATLAPVLSGIVDEVTSVASPEGSAMPDRVGGVLRRVA